MDDVKRQIHCYVRDNFLQMRPGLEVADKDHLLEKGIIDSVGVAELVVFLESEFQLAIGDDEITEENFATVANIVRYVAAKRGRTAPT